MNILHPENKKPQETAVIGNSSQLLPKPLHKTLTSTKMAHFTFWSINKFNYPLTAKLDEKKMEHSELRDIWL